MFRTVLLLALLGTGLLGLAACDPAPPASAAATYDPDTYDRAAPLSPTSIYQFDGAWETDAREAMALADLRGRPVALAMVYADCGTACPMIVHDMKQIGEAAGDTPLHYVLVTLDPERDTPEHLRAFRQMHGLGDDWTLLRGSPDAIQTLAALLGVRYRADVDGTIAHSNLITLLGPGGDIAARQEGLGTDPASTVAALHEALAITP